MNWLEYWHEYILRINVVFFEGLVDLQAPGENLLWEGSPGWHHSVAPMQPSLTPLVNDGACSDILSTLGSAETRVSSQRWMIIVTISKKNSRCVFNTCSIYTRDWWIISNCYVHMHTRINFPDLFDDWHTNNREPSESGRPVNRTAQGAIKIYCLTPFIDLILIHKQTANFFDSWVTELTIPSVCAPFMVLLLYLHADTHKHHDIFIIHFHTIDGNTDLCNTPRTASVCPSSNDSWKHSSK